VFVPTSDRPGRPNRRARVNLATLSPTRLSPALPPHEPQRPRVAKF
jgi:hypothetical protein